MTAGLPLHSHVRACKLGCTETGAPPAATRTFTCGGVPMAATSPRSTGLSSTNIVHRGEAGTGPFMLTLCRLADPVSIRPPQSPHLKPFTFFTSRAPQRDGSEELYLHMGFFETLANAERWVRAVRPRHPHAIANIAPRSFWPMPDFDAPSFPPVDNPSLSDTQVLNILEARHPAPEDDTGSE